MPGQREICISCSPLVFKLFSFQRPSLFSKQFSRRSLRQQACTRGPRGPPVSTVPGRSPDQFLAPLVIEKTSESIKQLRHSTFPMSSNRLDFSSERVAESAAQELQAPAGSLETGQQENRRALKQESKKGAHHNCSRAELERLDLTPVRIMTRLLWPLCYQQLIIFNERFRLSLSGTKHRS